MSNIILPGNGSYGNPYEGKAKNDNYTNVYDGASNKKKQDLKYVPTPEMLSNMIDIYVRGLKNAGWEGLRLLQPFIPEKFSKIDKYAGGVKLEKEMIDKFEEKLKEYLRETYHISDIKLRFDSDKKEDIIETLTGQSALMSLKGENAFRTYNKLFSEVGKSLDPNQLMQTMMQIANESTQIFLRPVGYHIRDASKQVTKNYDDLKNFVQSVYNVKEPEYTDVIDAIQNGMGSETFRKAYQNLEQKLNEEYAKL